MVIAIAQRQGALFGDGAQWRYRAGGRLVIHHWQRWPGTAPASTGTAAPTSTTPCRYLWLVLWQKPETNNFFGTQTIFLKFFHLSLVVKLISVNEGKIYKSLKNFHLYLRPQIRSVNGIFESSVWDYCNFDCALVSGWPKGQYLSTGRYWSIFWPKVDIVDIW